MSEKKNPGRKAGILMGGEKKFQYQAGSEVGQVLNPGICLSLWKREAIGCPGALSASRISVSAQSKRKIPVPGLTLECSWPSPQTRICWAVLRIPKSSRTSQRSRLWLGLSKLAGICIRGVFFRSCIVASEVIPEDGKGRDRWEKLIPEDPSWDL